VAAKRGALIALLGLGGGKSSDPAEAKDGARYAKGTEPDADEMGGAADADGDDYDADFAAFADAAGIPEARRAGAEAALKRFVSTCKGMTTEE